MTQTASTPQSQHPHVIKRYGSDRLYDTTTLSYATRDQLRALATGGADVVIYEAADGTDITRTILAHD